MEKEKKTRSENTDRDKSQIVKVGLNTVSY